MSKGVELGTDKFTPEGVELAIPILGQKRPAEEPVVTILCAVVPGAAAMGVPALFLDSWTGTVRSPEIMPMLQVSGPVVHRARNLACEAAKNSPAEYLMFIDSDQVWNPMDMGQFIRRAADGKKDVVTGIVNRMVQSAEGVFTHPAVFDAEKKPLDPPEEGGYTEAAYVGAGALLISKRMLVAMKEDWFTPSEGSAEDFAFSEHARAQGVTLYADWDFRCGHLKQWVF